MWTIIKREWHSKTHTQCATERACRATRPPHARVYQARPRGFGRHVSRRSNSISGFQGRQVLHFLVPVNCQMAPACGDTALSSLVHPRCSALLELSPCRRSGVLVGSKTGKRREALYLCIDTARGAAWTTRQACERGSRIKTLSDTFDVSEHSGHCNTGMEAVHYGAPAAVSLLYCGCTNHV